MRVPPVIRTLKEVKAKIELLEALGDIQVRKVSKFSIKENVTISDICFRWQVAMKILNEGSEGDEDLNPVDRHYRQLDCQIRRLEKESEEFR